MNALSTRTLSQIVNENFEAARIFEKYGLDFCCKGKRPLEQACREKEIGLDTVLQELDTVMTEKPSGTGFHTMSLTELTNYIVEHHHSYIRLQMPQIFNYLMRIAFKHGDRFPHMKDVYLLFADMQEDLEQHLLKEEKVLFPRIQQLESREQPHNSIDFLQAPIDIMEEEHDAAGETMAQIRELTNNYTVPPQACTTHQLTLAALKAFEENLHQHVHLENNVLFPRAYDTFLKINPQPIF